MLRWVLGNTLLEDSRPERWVPSLRTRFTINVVKSYERLFTTVMVLGNNLDDVEDEGDDMVRGMCVQYDGVDKAISRVQPCHSLMFKYLL